jgi:leader peptidase (prepilin peptidase)/N-methyltransferase
VDLDASHFAILALLGGAVGSFLNVVAYRLPRRLSIVGPRSLCPSCGSRIAAHDNVPILSWLWLRGRCRSCRSPISIRYPVVEALTATLFVAVAARADGAAELVAGLVLVSTLVAVAAIDLDHRVVPNRILLPAALAGVVIWALLDADRLPGNTLAGLIAGVVLLLPALVYPQGMGMGDVKLAAVLGLFLGRAVAPALFAAFLAGSVVGVGIMLARGASARKHAIPFAPYLALGGIVGQLAGDDIVSWYLDGPF